MLCNIKSIGEDNLRVASHVPTHSNGQKVDILLRPVILVGEEISCQQRRGKKRQSKVKEEMNKGEVNPEY